ncbi:MAG: hypothetical protein EA357_02645 [Micavibrio sp.]|nr:MAG: hypothetical protein EA357_02645 [Micavibrio sp.]
MTEEQRKENGEFRYGWCYTDRKNGKEIRRWYRNKDYMRDEPYASAVKTMLDELGLPQPQEGEIFRGSHHDLLFLNSHGVVLRIGPTDVEELIHPAILQPLGWREAPHITIRRGGKDVPLTVAVYPGIELYENYLKQDGRPELAGKLRDILVETGYGTTDIEKKGNTGVIDIPDEDERRAVVEILLDPDDKYNAATPEKSKRKREIFADALKRTGDKSAALALTLRDAFKNAQEIKPFLRAFQLHQPLRNLFARAFAEHNPDKSCLQAFWDACAAAKQAPHPMKMSHWTSVVGEDGRLHVKRVEVTVDRVTLKTPWTEKPEKTLKSQVRKRVLSLFHKSVNTAVSVKKPKR